jgi:hypothetical protein
MSKNKEIKKVNQQITSTQIKVNNPVYPIYLPILIFILTTIIFFLPQLLGSAFFWEDFLEYFYPVQTLAAKEFAKGTIPFWNPYSLSGMPFLADIQVGFFYPFHRLMGLFIDSNGMLPIWIVQFVAILHFFFAQLNFYILARYLKISSWGAIIGAITYSFAFPIVLHIIHPMIVYHLTWFPLIFYFFKKSLDNNSIKNGVIAGLIFGFTMLSGHPQVTLYFALILGIYFVWDILPKLLFKKENSADFNWKALIAGVLTFTIAVGIFMVQFLPTNELAKHSVRAVTSYEKSSENSLQFKQIATLIQPKIFGYYNADNQTDFAISYFDTYDGKEQPVKNYYYWETALYFGILPLILGILGMLVVKKDKFKWFLIAIIIFGFLYALGKYFILHPIFYYLPFFGTFRNPVRMFTFSMFGFSLFSGYAFDFIAENLKNKKLLNNFLIISGSVVFLLLLSQIGVLQSILSIPTEYSTISSQLTTPFLIISIFSLFIGFLYIQNILKPFVVGALFSILIFVDLYISGASYTQSKVNIYQQYQTNDQLKKFLKAQPPSSIFRVKTRIYSPSYMAVKRNQGMVDEIFMLEGYNPLVLKLASVPFPWEQSLQLQNVKYDLKIDSIRGNVSFYERTNQLGPAWIVTKATFVAEDSTSLYFYEHHNDFSQEVLINTPDVDLSKYQTIDSLNNKNYCKLVEYSANEQKYDVSITKPSIMVFSDIYYPEWKAEIDNQETRILQANHSFRAIELPAGHHNVTMKYSTKRFAFGAIISISSILLSIVLLFIFKEKNNNK